VVLQVVRLSRIKRPELLLHAAEILSQQRQDLLFVLIGDGEMRQQLEQMVVERGLQNTVRFIGALYDESVLSSWYLSASVFVVPTFIGLSAHHAMSYGLPIVTDDSLDSQGSEFDIIADGLNALTYREGDAQCMAEAIDRVTNDKELQNRLAANAIQTVREKHNLVGKSTSFVRLCTSNEGPRC
jgi:glycosyltransferase involved in cell wall biosynthesis